MVNQDSAPDPHPIVFKLACYDFPWDVTRALELALFRSFAGPRIAKLLAQTGEFTARARRRYDDTDLLISCIVEYGPDSDLGRRALARMNAIHGRFTIANEDFLYVLSTFVFEPIRWIDRFGWRGLTEIEREAWFQFWCAVGRAMNITDIPPTRAAFEAESRAYEDKYFVPSREAHEVAFATARMFAEPAPAFLRPLILAGITGLLDERLRAAIEFPRAQLMGRLMRGGLGFRKIVLRLLPKRRHPRRRLALPRPQSHPDGFTPETLGPPSFPH
jgi:hypothetical protein